MRESVSVRIDFDEVTRMLRAGDRVYEQAAASSLNKAVRKERTAMVREIAERANIAPRKLIRSRMKFVRATRTKLRAGLRFLTQPVPASRLAAVRQTAQGVSARGHSWRSAFLRIGLGGKRMAFRREGRPRLPVDAMKVPVEAIANEVMKTRIKNAAQHLAQILPKEIIWRLSRGAR